MKKVDRSALLLGKKGREIIFKTSGVVAGCGGVGSPSAVQLAHCGFGELHLIDNDIVEESNRPRIIGSTPEDVINKSFKVDVIKRYINQCVPECKVYAHRALVQDESVKDILIDSDYVVIGTDNAKSRGYINELAHRYYNLVLDLGVEFYAPGGVLSNEIGKVNLMLPGAPCLWCAGHVSAEMIANEELSPYQQKKLAQEGYIKDTTVVQPSMMPYNSEVASRGIQLLIHQMTGLSVVEDDLYERISFFGLNGRSHHKLVRKLSKNDCPFCCAEGSVLGHGDDTSMIIV